MHWRYSQDNTTMSNFTPFRGTAIQGHSSAGNGIPGEVPDMAYSSWPYTDSSPTQGTLGHRFRSMNAVYSTQNTSCDANIERPGFSTNCTQSRSHEEEHHVPSPENFETESWLQEMHPPAHQDTQAASTDQSAYQLSNELSRTLSTPPNDGLARTDAGGWEREVQENISQHPYDTDEFDEQFDDATLMSIHDHFSFQVSPKPLKSVPLGSQTCASSAGLQQRFYNGGSPIQLSTPVAEENRDELGRNANPAPEESDTKTDHLMPVNGGDQGIEKGPIQGTHASSNVLPSAQDKVKEGVPCSPRPFVRPPFPKPVPGRSPIQGLTSTHTVLRTCFRIGEALKASLPQSRNKPSSPSPIVPVCTGNSACPTPSPSSPSPSASRLAPASDTILIELYAFVEHSYRSNHTQYFRFVDLFFPSRPPYLSGLWQGWRDNPVFDDDGRAFLGRGGREWTWNGAGSAAAGEKRKRKDDAGCTSKKFGEGRKMCRAIGVIERREKGCTLEGTPVDGIMMTVLSIWEAQWFDVQYVKGIVEA